LDGAAAFVHPGAMAEVAARGKDDERAALATIEHLLGASIARRDVAAEQPDDLLGEIMRRWADVDGDDRLSGISRDIALVHI
ncbi:hypothetical protein ABTA72_19890, partial [Acinetobacter baumannii]